MNLSKYLKEVEIEVVSKEFASFEIVLDIQNFQRKKKRQSVAMNRDESLKLISFIREKFFKNKTKKQIKKNINKILKKNQILSKKRKTIFNKIKMKNSLLTMAKKLRGVILEDTVKNSFYFKHKPEVRSDLFFITQVLKSNVKSRENFKLIWFKILALVEFFIKIENRLRFKINSLKMNTAVLREYFQLWRFSKQTQSIIKHRKNLKIFIIVEMTLKTSKFWKFERTNNLAHQVIKTVFKNYINLFRILQKVKHLQRSSKLIRWQNQRNLLRVYYEL